MEDAPPPRREQPESNVSSRLRRLAPEAAFWLASLTFVAVGAHEPERRVQQQAHQGCV